MIADLPVFPYVIGGGLLLAVVCGLFLSAAALVVGIIRRPKSVPRQDFVELGINGQQSTISG